MKTPTLTIPLSMLCLLGITFLTNCEPQQDLSDFKQPLTISPPCTDNLGTYHFKDRPYKCGSMAVDLQDTFDNHLSRDRINLFWTGIDKKLNVKARDKGPSFQPRPGTIKTYLGEDCLFIYESDATAVLCVEEAVQHAKGSDADIDVSGFKPNYIFSIDATLPQSVIDVFEKTTPCKTEDNKRRSAEGNELAQADDLHGHGTMVLSSYLYGLKKLEHDLDSQRILPVKVMNASGKGSMSDIACGDYYAIHKHTDVIKMSLGGPMEDAEFLKKAIDLATGDAHKILVVTSAGNDGQVLDNSRRHVPSEYSALAMGTNQRVFEIGSLRLTPKQSAAGTHIHTWNDSNRRNQPMFFERSIHLEEVFDSVISFDPTVSLEGTSFATPLFAAAVMHQPDLQHVTTTTMQAGSSSPAIDVDGGTGTYDSALLYP